MIFRDRPAVIGHRGFGHGSRAGYRENTPQACLAAVAAGLTWVEVDVQRTADSQLVVHHDAVAPDGRYLADQTAADLARQGISTLGEVMAALPAEVCVVVDVKTVLADAADPPSLRTVTLLGDALAGEASGRQILVSSFDPSLPVLLRSRLPAVAAGLLTWAGFPLYHGIPAASGLGMDVVCVQAGSLGGVTGYPGPRDPIAVAHRAGLEVLAWCPGPAEAVRLAGAGADALCVDDVPGVLAALGRRPALTGW